MQCHLCIVGVVMCRAHMQTKYLDISHVEVVKCILYLWDVAGVGYAGDVKGMEHVIDVTNIWDVDIGHLGDIGDVGVIRAVGEVGVVGDVGDIVVYITYDAKVSTQMSKPIVFEQKVLES